MRRNGIIGSIHPDPILGLADELEIQADEKAETGDLPGASLCRIIARRIRERCEDLVNHPVSYGETKALTGYPTRSILNMKDGDGRRLCPNVGTGNAGAFRLGDLPFKAGHGSPSKARIAAQGLRQQEAEALPTAREKRIRAQARRAS